MSTLKKNRTGVFLAIVAIITSNFHTRRLFRQSHVILLLLVVLFLEV
jgi:hypothetical protein